MHGARDCQIPNYGSEFTNGSLSCAVYDLPTLISKVGILWLRFHRDYAALQSDGSRVATADAREFQIRLLDFYPDLCGRRDFNLLGKLMGI